MVSFAIPVLLGFVKTVMNVTFVEDAKNLFVQIAACAAMSAISVKYAQLSISVQSASKSIVTSAIETTRSVNCAVNICAGRKYAKLTTSQPVSSRTLRFVIDKIDMSG